MPNTPMKWSLRIGISAAVAVALVGAVLFAGRLSADEGLATIGDEIYAPNAPLGGDEAKYATLDLYVTDDSKPLAGVKVSVLDGNGVEVTGTSNGDGWVNLTLVRPSSLSVTVAEIGTAASANFPEGDAASAELVVDFRAGTAALRFPRTDGVEVLDPSAIEPAGEDWGPSSGNLVHFSADEIEADRRGQNEDILRMDRENRLRAIPTNDAYEPDSCAAPISVSSGSSLNRALGIMSDQDFFQISLNCGDTIRVDVTPSNDELQAIVDIYSDATCTTILTNGSSGVLGNGLVATLMRSVSTAGTYRIRVRSTAVTNTNSWGLYNILFTVTPGACPANPPTAADSGETDACGTPAGTLDNGSVIDGRSVYPTTDGDFYNMQVNCGDVVRINMIQVGTGTLSMTPRITLYADAGCASAAVTATGTAGNPAWAQFLATNPTFNGTWKVRFDSSNATAGHYKAAVAIYRNVLSGLCNGDAYDFGDDTAAGARPLPINGSELHKIVTTPGGIADQDWFTVTPSCGDRLIIRTLRGGKRDGATTVTLLDPTGTTTIASDTTGGGSNFSQLDYTVTSTTTPGALKVRVTSSTVLSSYQIVAESIPGTPPLSAQVTEVGQTAPPGVTVCASAATQTVQYSLQTTAGVALQDIAATGTQISLHDDQGRGVPIGFPFVFYGDAHRYVSVGSNGYLTFGNAPTSLSNVCPVPNSGTPNDLIAPMWDDMAPHNGGGVLYATVGTAPNRRFIAQWDEVPFFSATGQHTFQAILYEGTNEVEYRYGTLTGGGTRSQGDSATVGIENRAGTTGLAASCNQASLATGLSYKYTPSIVNGPWPVLTGFLYSTGASPLIDIHLTGTPLSPGDDTTHNGLPIGFNFTFDGGNYSTFNVSSNGFGSFLTLSSSYLTNSCPMISTSLPNATVAPFWDDLNAADAGSPASDIYYQTVGTAPNRQFIVMWYQVPHYGNGTTSQYNFELILNETTNVIEFRYGSMTGTYSDGSSASIGVENTAGNGGYQVACNTAGSWGGTHRLFTPTILNAPSYAWKNPATGVVLGTNSCYFQPAQTNCQILLEVTANDGATGCQKTYSQLLNPDCTPEMVVVTGGPYVSQCQQVTLGNATVDYVLSDPLTFTWSSPDTRISFVPSTGTIPSGSGVRPVPPVQAILASNFPPCGISAPINLSVVAPNGDSGNASTTLSFSDTTGPTLIGVPAAIQIECGTPYPPAVVTATDCGDPNPTVTYSSTSQTLNCPANRNETRRWTGRDRCNNTTIGTQVVQFRDTQPPVVQARTDEVACLWPPNHNLVEITRGFVNPVITDACSAYTYLFSGASSNQCADAPCPQFPGQNGDGTTAVDVAVSPNGQSVLLRAERAGSEPDGRLYLVEIIARDACGNVTQPTPIGGVAVPHDQDPQKECINSSKVGEK